MSAPEYLCHDFGVEHSFTRCDPFADPELGERRDPVFPEMVCPPPAGGVLVRVTATGVRTAKESFAGRNGTTTMGSVEEKTRVRGAGHATGCHTDTVWGWARSLAMRES